MRKAEVPRTSKGGGAQETPGAAATHGRGAGSGHARRGGGGGGDGSRTTVGHLEDVGNCKTINIISDST